MASSLLSVGVDVGTTTTQLIVSRLTVEDRSSAFSVPELTITDRQILYESPIHFTPLLDAQHIHGEAVREIVTAEYARAGIRREDVDTGAIIITGETSRKENARAVLEALSDLAGDFVVATAGPDLESALSARGAGAVALSARTEGTVLHMDIGGGTSNLAWIRDGKIVATSCLNVGGRLLKFGSDATLTYVSPVLSTLTDLRPGDRATEPQLTQIAQLLTQALEMAAGLRPATQLLQDLTTAEAQQPPSPEQFPQDGLILSFSGGVADCIDTDHPSLRFGDLGVILGRAIRHSRLCQRYVLGEHTIRATVIGAGCHSAQLSGSTVLHRNVRFPLKGLPVAQITDPAQIPHRLAVHDVRPVFALPGVPSASYAQTRQLADAILDALPQGPIYLALEHDMAKALGQALALGTEASRPILCLDRLQLTEGSYLDVAAPIGPALPVVIKTLILSH